MLQYARQVYLALPCYRQPQASLSISRRTADAICQPRFGVRFRLWVALRSLGLVARFRGSSAGSRGAD